MYMKKQNTKGIVIDTYEYVNHPSASFNPAIRKYIVRWASNCTKHFIILKIYTYMYTYP